MGGKLDLYDDNIFPRGLGCYDFIAPTKTRFTEVVKDFLGLGEGASVKVKSIDYSPAVILITISNTPAPGSDPVDVTI